MIPDESTTAMCADVRQAAMPSPLGRLVVGRNNLSPFGPKSVVIGGCDRKAATSSKLFV
ncbi:hypothetical protein [Brevundimonas sp. TWP1-2-1b1]|uniref:hypothetical protein n=1 Tax=unclassified Brevundimonas TaxID=2622653 RepID=UPI003CE95AF2